jgi:stage III sporulation protein AD
MSIIKYCGLVIFALFTVLLTNELKRDIGKLVGVCVGVGLLIAAIGKSVPVFSLVKGLLADTALAPYFATLLKALGVSLAVEFCADLCKDLGESSLAGRLEMLGKVELLLLALPLFQEVVDLAGGLLS